MKLIIVIHWTYKLCKRMALVTLLTLIGIIAISAVISALGLNIHIVDDKLRLHYETYQMNCDVFPTCRNRMQPAILYVTTVDKFPSWLQEYVGICNPLPLFGMGNKWVMFGYITVLPPYSSELSGPYQYKALVYHELAHCIHGVMHNEYTWIMPSSLRSNEILQRYWYDAVYELFGREIH